MDQGITIFNGNLKLIAWNRRFLELLEFPETLAFAGADFASFIRFNADRGEYGPGNRDAQVATRVAEARQFQAHQVERQRPDGTIVRVVGSPLPDGGFVSVYTDVTNEKYRNEEWERRVTARTSALRDSQARLRLIADEVPAGIAHLDENLIFLFGNVRFARAYGLTPDELVGRSAYDTLHPDTMRESARYFEQCRRGKLVDFEMNALLGDGSRRDIRTFLRPATPSKGEVIGFYLLSVDITRRKAASEALLRAQKMDSLGRLSSGISHDFNNLLTIILGNLSQLSERIDDDELRRSYLMPAIAAARKGSGLTRRLLTLARREPYAPSAVDVVTVVDDLVSLLKSTTPSRVAISANAAPDIPVAYADLAQLEMALLNMAVNAQDAIFGTGEIHFAVDHYTLTDAKAQQHKIPAGDYVRIRIIDDGQGIEPEKLRFIFEPFFTSKANGKGTGLGLSMVYGFVRQSNGAIWAESTPGKGSTFTMLLPLANSVAGLAASHMPQPRKSQTGDCQIILLVEDDAQVRRVLRRSLVGLGHPLVEAENADQALHMIKTIHGIALVLSDVSMPGKMNGFDLARQLRAEQPGLGVVLMSGQYAPADLPQDLAGVRLLTKPFSTEELSSALADTASLSRLTKLQT